MGSKRLLWGLVALAAGGLALAAAVASGGAASTPRLVAEEPGLLRFEVAGPDGRPAAGARGRFVVEKVRGGSPWFFTNDLPTGPVLAGPFAAPQGTVELRLTLWDPGRYRVVYTVETAGGRLAGGSLPVSVRPASAKLRNTVSLFAGLILLGLAGGHAAGSLRRPPALGPGRRGPAGGLAGALLLVGAGLVAAVWPGEAHGHGARGPLGAGMAGEQIRGRLLRVTPLAPTVKQPVRMAIARSGAHVSLKVRREEDGLVFLDQEVRGYGEPAAWAMVFPDGTRYALEAAAGGERETLRLEVSPLPPDGGQQARSFAFMLGLYGMAATAGFRWARSKRRGAIGWGTYSP